MPDRLIPRAHLFGNPNRLNGTISPDGTHLAWVAPLDGVMNVWIAPRDAPEQARAVTHDTKRGVRDYYWAYDGQHLLFLQDRDGDENWRLHAVNVHTGETRKLTPEGARATPAGTSRHVRDAVLVTLNQRDPSYPDLFRVELATGEMTVVAENPGFAGFMADDRYVPRLALRSTPDGGMDILRPASDGTWADWDHIPAEDAFSTAVSHLNADGTTLYMRDSRGRDTAALVAVDLATGARNLLAEDARADIGGVLTDRDTYAPLAYHVTVERLSYIALDPRVQPDLDFLATQDIGDWWIMSRTEDDRLWIVGAHSDTRPGMAYLYDREARDLRLLYETRPELSGAPLSRMHPVTIPARDGLILVCYLTLPRRVDQAGTGRPDAPGPLVLLVHGGPWLRDTFGYNWYAQWLANRGYAVMTVNFRGSTGLGKHVVNAGNLEWGRRMDDDLLDAVAWAVEQRIADPARIAIFGGSYGGYAVLASMTRNPELYRCGVDVVGPSNLETLLATVPPVLGVVSRPAHPRARRSGYRGRARAAAGALAAAPGRAHPAAVIDRAGRQRSTGEAGGVRPDGGGHAGEQRAGHVSAVSRRGAWFRAAGKPARIRGGGRAIPRGLPGWRGCAGHRRGIAGDDDASPGRRSPDRTVSSVAGYAFSASAFTSSIASTKRWLISASASALECWMRSRSSCMLATARS